MDSLVIANDSNELNRIVNNLNLKAQALFLDIYYKNGVMSLSLTSPSQEYKNIHTTCGLEGERSSEVKDENHSRNGAKKQEECRTGHGHISP